MNVLSSSTKDMEELLAQKHLDISVKNIYVFIDSGFFSEGEVDFILKNLKLRIFKKLWMDSASAEILNI